MWGPEAWDAPGPSFPEGLLDELPLRGRVYPPERPFAGLLLRPRHFDEITVQRQVVTNRVLQQKRKPRMKEDVTEGKHYLVFFFFISSRETMHWKVLVSHLCAIALTVKVEL